MDYDPFIGNGNNHMYSRRALNQYSALGTANRCGAGCIVYGVGAICLGVVVAFIILVHNLLKRMKLSRALKTGNVPASMLVRYWIIPAGEKKGEVENFTFKVHTAKDWSELKNDRNPSCAVCLEHKKKLGNWIILDGCNHFVCAKCFRHIAATQKLHSTCPLCRNVIVEGEGFRGGRVLSQPQENDTTPSSAPTTVPDVESIQ